MGRRRGFEEPNYTQTPNALFDVHLPEMGYGELKVMLVVVRQTFGWHRKASEPLSLSRLQKLTGLGRKAVSDGVQAALNRGVLQRRSAPGGSYVYEAVITEQATLLGGGSVVEPASSATEPAAGSASAPQSVRLPNRDQFGSRTPVKERKEDQKNPPSPHDEIWEAVCDQFEGSLGLNLRACHLVALDPLELDGPSNAVRWVMDSRRAEVEAALRKAAA